MFQTLVSFFKTKEVRNKIFFTLAMLVIFKIGTYIPAPGVNPEPFEQQGSDQGVAALLNTFGGGALKNFSIFAMGIMPYITASIVMQLLQMDIVPKFSEWAKQGEVGKRKLSNVTRYFAIILAFIQSIGMAFQFNNYLGGKLIIHQSIMSYLLIAVVLTAGTAFLIGLVIKSLNSELVMVFLSLSLQVFYQLCLHQLFNSCNKHSLVMMILRWHG